MLGPHRSLRFGVDHSLPRAEIFEPALSEFQTQARTNLDRHRFIDRLRCCESADSVNNFPQEQAKGSHQPRGDDGKVMTQWGNWFATGFSMSIITTVTVGISQYNTIHSAKYCNLMPTVCAMTVLLAALPIGKFFLCRIVFSWLTQVVPDIMRWTIEAQSASTQAMYKPGLPTACAI